MSQDLAPRVILVIESEQSDFRILEVIKAELGTTQSIELAVSAATALTYLQPQTPTQPNGKDKTQRPHLICLNLPGEEGRNFLSVAKSNSDLKRIPIIIFTDLRNENDIRQSYELYANCYIAIVNNNEELRDTVRKVQRFWLEIVTLPIE